MNLKGDAKFKLKLTRDLENGVRNLTMFIGALESLKIGTLMEYYYPKQKIYEVKIYRGIMCHNNEE